MKKTATGSDRDLPSSPRVTRGISSSRLAASCGLALAFLAGGAVVQAATFGHARLASGAGEPLLILVPVSGLTDADLKTLSARPAPAADWAQAGLTPPVTLDSLSVSIDEGVRSGSRRILRIGSGQAFSGNLADLLLDVRTATGQQRYQVSLVASGPVRATATAPSEASQARRGASAPAVGAAKPHTSTRRVPAGAISVRRGDTMFAIGRRHAVKGVSIYQLMMALQRANPQAFIQDNINLVRAGSSLVVPDINDMLSISDAEARRQFQAQAAAFARMRGRLADGAAVASTAGQAASGAVSQAESGATAQSSGTAGDRLRLSESGRRGADSAADARTARGHALSDAESRVEQLKDNVENLNEALQAQGQAAGQAAAQGAEAIGNSIGQIAGAISEASQAAAAQAHQAAAQSQGAGSAGAAGAANARGVVGATAWGTPSAAGAQTGSGAASGTGAEAGAQAASGSSSNASALDHAVPAQENATASAAGSATGAAARTTELQPSEDAKERVSWLQDHLLGVMTGLLALIVLIIAWLLRRANVARDEAEAVRDEAETEASTRVTQMVRERIQDIDLNLEPGDSSPPQR
ncbi:MAG: FimV family protein [Castellaniella sp.]|uniref:type IV pilus assembly protein FimV n=1 Tax=Castellaniella sp. TaxID=1955812 RepID=UPI003A85FE59